jgi:hypothetical protein
LELKDIVYNQLGLEDAYFACRALNLLVEIGFNVKVPKEEVT